MVESSRWKGTALKNLSGDKGTILVVDDEVSMCRILQTRLEMITNKRQVYKAGERIPLTDVEYSLLELLMSYPGKSFTRREILQQVWGYKPEQHADTRVVDVHISRLRSKLEDDLENPEYILTARGSGYFFQRIAQLEH